MRTNAITICFATIIVATIAQQIFVGGRFDQSTPSGSNGGNTSNKGAAIWDNQWEYWRGLIGGGLNSRMNSTSKEEIYCSYFDSNSNVLYVGGRFSNIGTINSTNTVNIVQYNIYTGVWQALANNIDGPVYAISYLSNYGVVIGGGFNTITTSSGSVTTGGAALWNPSNSAWTNIGGQTVTGTIRVLLPYTDNQMFFGGDANITSIGSVTVSGLAKFNFANNTWTSVAGGICGGSVYALETIGNSLFVGGSFSGSLDSSQNNCLQSTVGYALLEYDIQNQMWTNTFRFNSTSIGGSLIRAMANLNGNLIVSGDFTNIGTAQSPHLALWDGETWNPTYTSGFPFFGPINVILVLPDNINILIAGNSDEGINELNTQTKQWASLKLGVRCSFCPLVDGLRSLSTVYTLTLLPDGEQPPQVAPTPTPTPTNGSLIGQNGKWEEYGLPMFNGASQVYLNGSGGTKNNLIEHTDIVYVSWRWWSIAAAVVLVASFVVAGIVMFCFKSLTRI